MSAREAAARLLHDVGKYVARTARNLPAGGALDHELVAMLTRDLYALGAGAEPASSLFARLAAPLAALAPASAPRLAEVGALLAEVDRLRASVERRERAAVERAAHLALEVEGHLRALAVEAPR